MLSLTTMEPTLAIDGSYDKRDLVLLTRLGFWSNPRQVVLAFALLVFGGFVVYNGLALLLVSGSGIGLVFVAVGLLGWLAPLLFPRQMARRIWQRDPAMRAQREYRIDAEGIGITSLTGERLVRWPAAIRWRRGRDVILVELASDEVVALPARFFGDATTREHAEAVLTQRLGPPKSPGSRLMVLWRIAFGLVLLGFLTFFGLAWAFGSLDRSREKSRSGMTQVAEVCTCSQPVSRPSS